MGFGSILRSHANGDDGISQQKASKISGVRLAAHERFKVEGLGSVNMSESYEGAPNSGRRGPSRSLVSPLIRNPCPLDSVGNINLELRDKNTQLGQHPRPNPKPSHPKH